MLMTNGTSKSALIAASGDSTRRTSTKRPRCSPLILILPIISATLTPGCGSQKEDRKLVVVAPVPQPKTETAPQAFFCQIQSNRRVEIKAFETGYLDTLHVQSGQHVKAGDVLLSIKPTVFQAKLDVANADLMAATLEYNAKKKAIEECNGSMNELMPAEARLQKSKAKVQLAMSELDFAIIRAPFDGVIGRLRFQQGALIQQGDVFTTLTDDSMMWVYFNVSEARYLEYMTNLKQHHDAIRIELVLSNGSKYKHVGKIDAINADFNTKTGSIPFRADFPNPEHQLHHGQSGTVLLSLDPEIRVGS